MITSEQAFDMLPYVVEIYEKSDVEKIRRKLVLKYQGKKEVDPQKVAIEALLPIIKNTSKIKEEFFTIVAIADQKTVEEIKSQSLAKTINTFKSIFTDKELMDFFKAAMQ